MRPFKYFPFAVIMGFLDTRIVYAPTMHHACAYASKQWAGEGTVVRTLLDPISFDHPPTKRPDGDIQP